jgi:hypothetical protein
MGGGGRGRMGEREEGGKEESKEGKIMRER